MTRRARPLRSGLAAAALAAALGGCAKDDRFVVGSKPFTESEIVAEILAQMLEREGVPVLRRFRMGGMLCFEALKTGDMDAYVEYTGTGLVNVLHEPATTDPEEAYRRVEAEFRSRWGLVWGPRLGFNNSYALVMRRAHARDLGVARLSDLRKVGKRLRCGFDLVFYDRPDGYPGLVRRYGLDVCRELKQMDPGLMYTALAEGHVDVVSGYTTEGRIPGLDLVALEDDRRFFPPYHAAPLLSSKALERAPRLERVLRDLAGRIPDSKMMELNASVDSGRRRVRDVAREFLKAEGLLAVEPR